jgi:hypothetical protein
MHFPGLFVNIFERLPSVLQGMLFVTHIVLRSCTAEGLVGHKFGKKSITDSAFAKSMPDALLTLII